MPHVRSLVAGSRSWLHRIDARRVAWRAGTASLALVAAVGLSACASLAAAAEPPRARSAAPQAAVGPAARAADAAASQPALPRLPAPRTLAQAEALIEATLAAMEAHQPRHALVFLDALRRSDRLTDRGRANLYWMTAEAARAAGDAVTERDALGGFLVAAQLLPDDDIIGARARAAQQGFVALRAQAR